jgi:hypothetical protein
VASPKKQNEVFNRFSGLAQGILRWAGARRSGNAASIPPSMFRDLENVRFEGQDIVCRGGQVKYNLNDVLEGCIDGFIPPEFEPPDYKERLLICGYDTDGAHNGQVGGGELGRFVNGYDILEDAAFLHRAYISYIPGSGSGGSGGTLYESSTSFHDSDTGVVDRGVQSFTLDSSDDYTAGTLFAPGSATSTDGSGWGQVCKLGNDTFFVRHTTGNIIVYIGPIATATADRTVASDESTEARFSVWSVVYDSRMILPILKTRIDRRTTGGVWSTVAMPVSCTINRRHPGAGGVTFGADLYFCGYEVGGGNAVFKYDGSSITTVYNPADSPAEYQCLVSHNGALWFAYSPDNQGGELHYSPDGTTWSRITASSGFDGGEGVTQLISFDGRLYALTKSALRVADFPERFWRVEEADAGGFYSATVQQVR